MLYIYPSKCTHTAVNTHTHREHTPRAVGSFESDSLPLDHDYDSIMSPLQLGHDFPKYFFNLSLRDTFDL